MSDATRPTLVVNADDLGMTEATTDGILEAHRDGVVTSASLVVTTPALEHAVARIRETPTLGVGLHFSLGAGRPVSSPESIPALVDRAGRFRAGFAGLLVRLAGPGRAALLAQIERELEAQLARLESHGLRADHIDGERHVHLLPGVFERVAALATERGIRFVRRVDDVGARYVAARELAAVLGSGGPLKYALLRGLTHRARHAAAEARLLRARYATLLYTGRMELVLPRLLAEPPPGVTEVAVHPGHPPDDRAAAGVANPSLASYLRSDGRRRELEACIAARPAAAGVRLAGFAELARESTT